MSGHLSRQSCRSCRFLAPAAVLAAGAPPAGRGGHTCGTRTCRPRHHAGSCYVTIRQVQHRCRRSRAGPPAEPAPVARPGCDTEQGGTDARNARDTRCGDAGTGRIQAAPGTPGRGRAAGRPHIRCTGNGCAAARQSALRQPNPRRVHRAGHHSPAARITGHPGQRRRAGQDGATQRAATGHSATGHGAGHTTRRSAGRRTRQPATPGRPLPRRCRGRRCQATAGSASTACAHRRASTKRGVTGRGVTGQRKQAPPQAPPPYALGRPSKASRARRRPARLCLSSLVFACLRGADSGAVGGDCASHNPAGRRLGAGPRRRRSAGHALALPILRACGGRGPSGSWRSC